MESNTRIKKPHEINHEVFLKIVLSPLSESNQRPTDYKSVALPAELRRRNEAAKINEVTGIANV